jgi:hypothetical protein
VLGREASTPSRRGGTRHRQVREAVAGQPRGFDGGEIGLRGCSRTKRTDLTLFSSDHSPLRSGEKWTEAREAETRHGNEDVATPSNSFASSRPRARSPLPLRMFARSLEGAKELRLDLQPRQRREPRCFFPAPLRPCGKPSPSAAPRLRVSQSPCHPSVAPSGALVPIPVVPRLTPWATFCRCSAPPILADLHASGYCHPDRRGNGVRSVRLVLLKNAETLINPHFCRSRLAGLSGA